ncbi:hypothetical protein [Halobellus sp. GM3]|uniref:hypothetical protein n=1 Tax=Halobellus sp. GM3 TaxID=3458410 RepID=UPI00403D9136
MELTAAVVEDRISEYPDVQPLSAVEAEHVELLPKLFASGDYGWRDPEWVVQWYGRRFLGAMPNADRRELEAAYDENDYEAVHDAISAAVEADDAAEMLSHLTALSGVGVEVGSAFCQFIDPERYVVVDERQWSALREAGAFDGIEDLDAPYPNPPTVATYERYLERYRSIADRCGCSLWDLYRALWVLAGDTR